MELLDSYLKAVRRYLPRAQRDDIIAELSEELSSQMEARKSELGRPLSEAEQYAVLKQHGDPMIVARGYRASRRSLNIGWELIGPELFPMYLLMLALNLTIALTVTLGILLFIHQPISFVSILRPVLVQVVIVTLTFVILNLVRSKFPQPWYYPPAAIAPMIPVARWYSLTGVVVWGIATSWWALVVFFPVLFFASAAGELTFASSWHRFYLPVLLLLMAGLAQRAINLVRPDWTWLLPATRLVVNCIGLGLQYPMIKSYPYVLVAESAINSPRAHQVAAGFNGTLFWGVMSWLWVYLLADALIYAWYCMPHLRRLMRQNPRTPLTNELHGII